LRPRPFAIFRRSNAERIDLSLKKVARAPKVPKASGLRLSAFAVRLGYRPRLHSALGAVVLAVEKLRDRFAHPLTLRLHGCLEKLLLNGLRQVAPRARDAVSQRAINALLPSNFLAPQAFGPPTLSLR
jgi:hypothetical protein